MLIISVILGVICLVFCGALLIFGLVTYPIYKKQGGKKGFIEYMKKL